MVRVIFTHYVRGFQKLKMDKLLMFGAGLPLRTAFDNVNTLLRNEEFTIEMCSMEEAESLLQDAARLGAFGRILDETI